MVRIRHLGLSHPKPSGQPSAPLALPFDDLRGGGGAQQSFSDGATGDMITFLGRAGGA
jgi:TolB-like protein